MGELREMVGLARVVADPNRDPYLRRDSRERMRQLWARRFRRTGAAGPQRDRAPALYPAAWRMLPRQRTSDDLVVHLGAGPVPEGAAAGFGRSESDVLWLGGESSPWAALVPSHWNGADRLVAAANAGLLDGYARILVTDGSADAAVLPPSAADAVADPHCAGVHLEAVALSPEDRAQATDVLHGLRWEMPVEDVQRPGAWPLVCRGYLLQGLRAARIVPGTGLTDATLLTLLAVLARESGAPLQAVGDLAEPPVERRLISPRFVAFYLPQFHLTAENDRWWGPGFTEWTNVAAGLPNYPGHMQPKIPEDLGFYDLQSDAVREHQAALAEEAGVEAFMYYHYWFSGKRLLRDPIERHRAQTGLRQGLCVMWANEDWTRSWDGDTRSILMKQEHDEVPPADFIDDVLDLLADERYTSVDGHKILSVYRPDTIPAFPDVVAAWRERARRSGVELFVLGVEYGAVTPENRAALDGVMAFPPHAKQYASYPGLAAELDARFEGKALSYRELVLADIAHLKAGQSAYFPAVMPAWDNTARKQFRAHMWVGSNPYHYRAWLLAAAESVADRPAAERVVFINAWNEWAEGAMLEPSAEFGHSYLQATRDIARS